MRWDFYGQSDSRDATGGDQFFQGIDMTRDLPLLQPGMLSLGENTRTRTGHVIQRRGTTQPADFNPSGTAGMQLVGSSVFKNPNGEEVLLIAPAFQEYTYVLQDTKEPYRVNYAAAVSGSNGRGSVELVQAFEKVLLLRRPPDNSAVNNLVWDGVSTQSVPGVADSEWENTTLSPEGLTLVPDIWNAEPFMDRVLYYFANALIPSRRDTWLMSDVLDYTSYDPVFQSFRTNSAQADSITRIMAYFKGSVVIFKTHSIHMASVQATFPVSIQQRILNSTVGSIGNKMPLMVGADIIFLSKPNGFYSLSEIIQEQIAALPVPISEPIQRVIDDINWRVTSAQGSSAALDNYAFFGVCLKSRHDQESLNAVLVYDTQRKVWESAGDTWADETFCFSALHVTNYAGVHRLFAIDYVHGIVYLLYEGVNDDTRRGRFNVPFRMKTRGYVGDDPISFKRFGRAVVGIQTNDPLITVTAITDGFNERKLLTPEPLTKDRRIYYSHGVAPFDPETDDEDAPFREDYSVLIDSDFAGNDFESMPVGEIEFVPATLPPEESVQEQESLERFIVRSQGVWCALEITNDHGSCEVNNVSIESTRSCNTVRTAA